MSTNAPLKPYGIDVSVAIIFFTRTDTLEKVFEQVKKARPSRLFLIQDGPRENTSDLQNIEACRRIVENIDWDCEVKKNYSDRNLGCGMRPYSGVSWVFEHTEEAIIIEDDCIVADSFFPFCKEMLERYREDLRIGIISSWNHFEEFDFGGYSYGFCKSVGCGAWATWRNRWEKCDYYLNNYSDYVRELLKNDISPSFAAKKKIHKWDVAQKDISEGINISYWDNQWNLARHINSWLTITPKYNQLTNVGFSEGATHFKKAKKPHWSFNLKRRELEFPLIHPEFVIANREYDNKYYKKMYIRGIKLLIAKIKQYL